MCSCSTQQGAASANITVPYWHCRFADGICQTGLVLYPCKQTVGAVGFREVIFEVGHGNHSDQMTSAPVHVQHLPRVNFMSFHPGYQEWQLPCVKRKNGKKRRKEVLFLSKYTESLSCVFYQSLVAIIAIMASADIDMFWPCASAVHAYRLDSCLYCLSKMVKDYFANFLQTALRAKITTPLPPNKSDHMCQRILVIFQNIRTI